MERENKLIELKLTDFEIDTLIRAMRARATKCSKNTERMKLKKGPDFKPDINIDRHNYLLINVLERKLMEHQSTIYCGEVANG